MSKEEIAGAIIAIAVLLIIPFLTIAEGWALAETWRLLLMPAAMDYAEVKIKPLSIGVAIAIAYVIRQFFNTGRDKSDSDKKSSWATILTIFGKPLLTVFFAWLLSLFIFGGQ